MHTQWNKRRLVGFDCERRRADKLLSSFLWFWLCLPSEASVIVLFRNAVLTILFKVDVSAHSLGGVELVQPQEGEKKSEKLCVKWLRLIGGDDSQWLSLSSVGFTTAQLARAMKQVPGEEV